jgi:S-adenosylmethionine hydrolase
VAADPPSDAIITLTTDFGLSDPYVAALKGVILAINPRAILVDITHEVRPQQVMQATFVTQAAWPYFPPGATHLVVIDPGVGTGRRAVALETPRGRFVGPDNGVLSAALPDEARPAGGQKAAPVPLPPEYRAYAISNPRYMLRPVSATFHGRDIFAPAAAHLSLGVPIEELGERLDAIVALPPLRAPRNADGSLVGRVVHVDRFGNAITDIRAEDLPEHEFTVELGRRRVSGLARTYAEATVLSALVGSSGYLEVALRNGSAARELGVEIGDAAALRPA